MKTATLGRTMLTLLSLIALISCGQPSAATPTPMLEPLPEPTKTLIPTPTSIPTATPIPTPTPWPILVNDDIPEMEFTVDDPDSSIVWWEKRVIYGDDYYKNQLERPFTSKEMVYQPDLDILHASITSDSKFFYFALSLRDVDKETQKLTGSYGIEFDRTKNGRGDLLVWVHDVKEEWTVENVEVFVDLDKDIGGPNPNLSNPDFKGNGFESQLKMEGEKVAYSRFVPREPPVVVIAVSRLLLDNATEFLWSAWADKGINDPGKFYYNDNFTSREAGSPIKSDEVYPLAAVYSVDNTCFKPYGFTPVGNIPGMCVASSGSGPCVCPPCQNPAGGQCPPCPC